jgi:C4-dicarboxylate-specific signal transduction histidine kinase
VEGDPQQDLRPFHTTRKDGHGIGLSFNRVISKRKPAVRQTAEGGAVFRIELPWRNGGP